jgi:uncharacterized membrane protein YphA (DoxX/SURF4 family)
MIPSEMVALVWRQTQRLASGLNKLLTFLALPNMINFYKNISIAGGFLLLAIVGPGAMSIDRH